MRRAALILLALWLLLPAPATAEDVQAAVATQLQELDLRALTRAAEQQTLVSGDPATLLRSLASGKPLLTASETLTWLTEQAAGTLQGSLWRLTRLLIPALLMGLLEQLRGAFSRALVAKSCLYAGSLLALGFLVADMREHVALASGAVDGMASTMQALFPLLTTLLAAVGGTASAAFYQPAVVAAGGTMTALIQSVALPATVGAAVLTVVGRLCEGVRLTRLRRLFQQVAGWTLGAGFTVFIGVMMVQGLGLAAVDGVSIRTAKYAIDNSIPIVGGMFADTVDTLVGCSLLVKNAVGVLGLTLLLGVMAAPMLQTVLTMFLYRAAAAVLEPVSDTPLSRCIGDMADSYQLLFIIQLCVGAMFLLLVAQMLVVGDLTVMLR